MQLIRVNHSKKAFSLMEVLIIIMVLGTITSMSISSFFIFSEKARLSEGKQILISLLGAQKRWAVDNNGAYTDTLGNLDVIIPESSSFCTPVVKTSDPIASIERNDDLESCGGSDGLYIVTISSNGTISCVNVKKKQTICKKINY